MKTVFLLLSAAAVSFVGIPAEVTSLFDTEPASIAVVTQCHASSAIEYLAEIRHPTATALQLANFAQQQIAGNGLPINPKDHADKDFEYYVNYSFVRPDNNTLLLSIFFKNIYSYAEFNGLTLVNSEPDVSLFFREWTDRFNIEERFFATGKTAEIFKKFNEFNDGDVKYVYVLTNTSRRTNTNADKVVNNIGSYTYYFKQSDVYIFVRTANTPIWYGIAVGVTVIACLVFYFIVKKKRSGSADVSAQGQYQYPDSSH